MFEVSDSLTFRFTPSAAGKYEIYAVVNGIRTSVKTVIAYGKPLLSAGAYDFDSSYPDIFVTWDSSVQVDYSITIDGKTYDKTNAGERFDGTKFNVKDLINLKKGGAVKINSVASEYYTASEPLIIDIRPFSDDEIDYLAAKYAAGNYYMTDRYEFSILCHISLLSDRIPSSESISPNFIRVVRQPYIWDIRKPRQ